MRKRVGLLALLAAIVLIVWKLVPLKSSDTIEKYPHQGYKSVTLILGSEIIHAEVADTESLRGQGLSLRKSLPQDWGMLFIVPPPGVLSFWMKEMYFPLDFVWIKDKKVIDLTENVPPPKNINDTDLPIYSPKEPVDMALEVNAGTIKRLGIQIGTEVNVE